MSRVLWLVLAILALGLIQTAGAGDSYILEQGHTMVGDITERHRPIMIRGTVFGNLTGPSIMVDESGTVVGNIIAEGDDGSAQVAGRVTGTITAYSVTLLPTARVTGNIYPTGPNLKVDQAAVHFGRVIRPTGQDTRFPIVGTCNPPAGGVVMYLDQFAPWIARRALDTPFVFSPYAAMSWLPALLGSVALAVVLNALFPRFVAQSAATLTALPARSFGVGVLGLILVVPALALIAITIIGIPFVPVAAGGFFLLGLLGLTAAGLWLGRLVAPHLAGERWPAQIAVGVGLLAAIGWVPVAGAFILFVVWLFGLGAVLIVGYPLVRRRRRTEPPAGDTPPE